MRKQALLNLFMLLLVGGLAALVLWGPAPETPGPVPAHLTSLQAARIQRIEVAFSGRDPVTLRREDGRWLVDTPRRWPADGDRVRQVLALATAVSHASYPLAGLDAAEVGLAPPRVTLRLDDTGFAFGAQEPLNHYRYVLVGDRVHLVTDTLFHRLGERPLDWVSPRLVPEGAEIVAVRMPGLTLARDGRGAWITRPAQPARSQDDLNRFINAWRHARARVVAPAAGQSGDEVIVELGSPARSLRYTLSRSGHDIILEHGDRGLRYLLDASLAPQLFQLPEGETTR